MTGSQGGRLGRPERPVDPDAGPIQRLAWELRQLRREAGTPSYRVLAKRAHFAASTLAEAAKGERLPSLPVAVAYARACGGDAAEWETRWRAAAAEWDADRDADGEEAHCPYPGLAALTAADAGVFFGRAELVKEVLLRAESEPLVAVVGASGCGKSSVLRAGVLPEPVDGRHALMLVPGAGPLSALAAAVARLTGGEAERLGRQLADDPAASALALRTWLAGRPEDEHVLVVIDQFEETFTLCEDEGERDAFLAAVAELCRGSTPHLRTVIAVRTDFLAHCCAHEALMSVLRTGARLLVGPPTRSELRDIITQPAAAAGASVEPGLVEAVLADAGGQPGALPLVAHAMREVWRRHEGTTLRLADYRASGGIRGAIAQTAEQLYATVPARQQAALRALFVRLTALGEGTEDTRRRVRRAELDGLAEPAVLDALLHRLSAARLIVLADDTVEVAHEAVIRAWPRLQGWLTRDREALRTHRQLTTAAHTWQEFGRDKGALYRGSQLSTARAWAEGEPAALNDLEDAFLAASVAADRRRVRGTRGVIATLSLLLALALVSTTVALWQRSAAETQRSTAISRELAARADNLAVQRPEAAMIVALQGYRQARTAEARSSLLSAYARYYTNQLTGHTGAVDAVAFSPDGRVLATGSNDHTVKLWAPATHRLLATLPGHTDAVNGLAISPDGRTLATASNDHSVKLWDLSSRRTTATLLGHANTVTAVAFSPDGRTLASASSDHTVRLWDVASHRVRATLTGHKAAVNAVAFSPDGRALATSSSDRTTRLWDTTTHKTTATLTGHTDAVTGVAFSPDGRALATSSDDHTARLWDAATHRQTATLTGHSGKVEGVAFAPDGRTLATASNDHTVRLWDPAAHTTTGVLSTNSTVFAVAFAPDGRTLAGAETDYKAHLWDVRDQRQTGVLNGRAGVVTTTAFASTGRRRATFDQGDAVAQWTRGGRPALTPGTDPAQVVASTPDGRTLATADADHTVRVWDLTAGKPTAALPQPPGSVRALALSADARYVAAVGADDTARLWDTTTRRRTATLTGIPGPVSALALSADGRLLATAGSDGTARLWDTATRRRLATLTGHTNTVNALAFSPDDRTLGSVSMDHTARLWEVPSGHPEGTLAGHTNSVYGLAFSPDGRTLVTTAADHTARLWDVRSQRPAGVLTGSTIPLTGAWFSPDGRTLATVNSDRTAHLWDIDATDVARRTCAVIDTQRWSRLLPGLPADGVCR
ncbi:hypothetical protein ACFVFQ_36050 [Streptomyces sp. NPDC057743]|uniref:nSTAND1 domain-containing NTPase n=1 Tax=Streptomyces sp. NPDC057743 TaxID=3346236 RepID=UPI0036A301B9